MTRVGIMGGTFDPIHIGHLVCAESAREQFGLDRVIFVPAGRSPFKLERQTACADDRWAMVKLAIAGNPQFAASRIELDRQGPSYTVDTLRALKGETAAELYFIAGADTLVDLDKWRNPREIISLATLIAYPRPGTGIRRLKAAIVKLKAELGSTVELIRGPKVDISSTDIRERVRDGRSLRYIVPEAVADYIERQRLYS